MIKMILDGHEYSVYWSHCECSSYPIAVGFGHGHCGACGGEMQGAYDSREESEAARMEVNAC